MTPKYPHRYPTPTQIVVFAIVVAVLLIATLALVNGGGN